MNEFYLSEFYETINLSIMNIEVTHLDQKGVSEGTITFECDDFDDVSFIFGWKALNELSSSTVNFSNSKKRNGFKIGFVEDCQADIVKNINLLDDDADSVISKEKMIKLVKDFIHENFLWEDCVLKKLS